MKEIFCLLLVAVLLAAGPVSCANVATAPCNATIPIDSQTNVNSIWSLASFRKRASRLSGGAMTFEQRTLTASARNKLVAESGMGAESLTIFEIMPTTLTSLSSMEDTAACAFFLDPLKGGMDGIVAQAARFTVTEVGAATGAVCTFPLNVSMVTFDGKRTASLLISGQGSTFSGSLVFATEQTGTWPVTVSFNSQCTLQFALLVDRHGAIDRWFVWIPTTVYTAVVVALFLPTVVFRRRLSVHLAGVYLFLTFFGFLGSCIGLVIELLQWQSALGRVFPFPPPVTLYCCLSVLYVLLFLPILYRQGNNAILLMGAVRLLTYGLNCALCVGYWVAGYVVLGSLAAFQLLVTNFVLTWYYAYVTVHLRRAVRKASSVPKFSNNFLYLWCAPVTPFACCALMYYDLYLLTQRDIRKDGHAMRMRDVVRIYNAQMSLPLLFLQNVYGIALLAAATAYHMPLVVLLFVALLMWVVHAIHVVEDYCREWRRWHRCGGSLGTCGFISLSAVMNSLLFHGLDELSTSSPPVRETLHAISPSPGSVRRRAPPDQYEQDMAVYRNSNSTTSSSSDDDSSESSRRYGPQQRNSAQAVAFTTPSRQTISDNLEFWPSSVER